VERLGIHTEPIKAQAVSAPIKFDLFGQAGVTIDPFTNAEGEVIYRLQWNDYVVNEWNEYYATLSLALARVAVLSACIEEEVKNDTTIMFKSDSSTFADHAYQFINNQVK
jgi:hypothetical protein